MNNKLPDRVRSAMAQQPAPEPHPPGDLLNAFTENAVLPQERRQILDHLAICAECRQVILLASEAMEEPVPQPIRVPARRWRWMVWAAPATAAVVVVAAVLLDYRQAEPPRPATLARSETAPEIQGPVPQAATLPSSTVDSKPDEFITRDRAQTGAKERQDLDKVAKAARSVPAPSLDPKEKQELDLQSAPGRQLNELERKGSMANTAQIPPAFSAAAPPGAATETVVVEATSVPLNQLESAADRELRDQLVQPRSVQTTAAAPAKNVAKMTVGANGRNYSFSQSVQVEGALPAGAQPAPPNAHWRVTPEGAVEWSAQPNVWNRVLEGKPFKFRVVAVVGDDLWAGGETGELVHSIDRGATWKEVSPQRRSDLMQELSSFGADGARSKRDDEAGRTIVSIHFADVMNGEIRTASGERWVTTNRGQTWQRK